MVVVIDDSLRQQLFSSAPENGVWIGDLSEVGPQREVVPVRFAGVDFWFLFVSPHAEADNDPVFLRLMLNNIDVEWTPSQASRLVKFCRAEAEAEHFKPALWRLPHAHQIFQFAQVIRRVMSFYLDVMPDIRQFFYLPASRCLERLYSRVFRSLAATHPEQRVATLQHTGACHAYQRV